MRPFSGPVVGAVVVSVVSMVVLDFLPPAASADTGADSAVAADPATTAAARTPAARARPSTPERTDGATDEAVERAKTHLTDDERWSPTSRRSRSSEWTTDGTFSSSG